MDKNINNPRTLIEDTFFCSCTKLIQEAVCVRTSAFIHEEFDVSCCVIIITADTRDLNNIIITFNNNTSCRRQR